MQNPYNWIREADIYNTAFGFYTDNFIGSYIYWFPNEGPYTLYKEYTLFIDVNPTYRTDTVAYAVPNSMECN